MATKATRPGMAARDRLLQAASDLLASRDTLDISLMEIAARSGLNHGLVNYHFGGKEGLLLALLERDAKQALTALAKLVDSSKPPLEKLELHIRGVIDVYFRFPYINRLINFLQCSIERAADLARVFINPILTYQNEILEECKSADLIEKIDPLLFYYSIIGACDFPFNSRNTIPFISGGKIITDSTKEEYADHLVRLVLNGVRREKSVLIA